MFSIETVETAVLTGHESTFDFTALAFQMTF